MENKQTAVEWLIDLLGSHIIYPYSDIEEIILRAKEIERDQIEDAYNDAKHDSRLYANCLEPYHNDSSDYFTKTYNNGKDS